MNSLNNLKQELIEIEKQKHELQKREQSIIKTLREKYPTEKYDIANMKQLIINIYKNKKDRNNKKCFAKVYYPDSGYTSTATLEISKLMKDFPKDKKLSDSQLAQYFVRQLEKQGGGLYLDDLYHYNNLTKDGDYSTLINEDNGIIAFSNEFQNKLQDKLYEKAEAFIYLDEFTFNTPIAKKNFDLKNYCQENKINFEEYKKRFRTNSPKFDIDKDHPIERAENIAKALNNVISIVTSDYVIYMCIN